MKNALLWLVLITVVDILVLSIFLLGRFNNAVLVFVLLCITMFLSYLFCYKTRNGREIAAKIRGGFYQWIFKTKHLTVHEGFRYRNPQCISIGHNVSIDHDTEFYPVVKYNECEFPSEIRIGNNVHIGAYNRFASRELVEIEDDVLFAAYVHITDHSHDYRDVNVPVYMQGLIGKGPVRIGKGTWIGLRCSILSGVTIGEHCVIATGAVVTNDIPSYSIAGGVPAKVIKKYDFEKKEWVKPTDNN